jgi:hypothetical protein
MLNDNERSRLGELRSRVDLSVEEKREMSELMQRVREERFGKIGADLLLIEDSGGGRLIPHSERAKRVLPSELVLRDRDQLNAYLRDLEKQGLTIQRERAA